MAAVTQSRKRPGTDQETILGSASSAPGSSGAGSSSKRPRYAWGNIDDYERLEVLGEGSYGVVEKARDRRTGKKVALKWVRGEGDGGHGPPDRRAITMEADLQTGCRGHPSIVEIMDVAADAKNGDTFIVMEFVGPSLRENLWRRLSEDVARVMMLQLVAAANKIHSVGMIHRDIKPENVLVAPFGDLKVCDFGAATRIKPPGKPYEPHAGTLIYTSPEQLAGNLTYGPAVDMWALGCVMAELLLGAPLFGAETKAELLDEMSELQEQITSPEPAGAAVECLEDLSPDGREFLIGLLAFCPEERLTAAEALQHPWLNVKALASWLRELV